MILAVDIGVGPLFDPLVRETEDPGRDADEDGREVDVAAAGTGLINVLAALEGGEITSESALDADEPRGRLEVFRVLVVVVVTVVVGRVLARRGFSGSRFLAERTRPVLIVGALFRGDGDGRVRRLSVGVFLTGVISALPLRRTLIQLSLPEMSPTLPLFP